ncbi:MAG TPA: ABC transporter ATP-binding protein, partial [Acidimicrobiia bacterium]|nr:ABC transporter ATP-binding protein [Acidimicrobiia bacterium]
AYLEPGWGAMSRLEIRELRVRFGERVAVGGVTVVVDSGEWLGVIGPNGSGKTSLLRGVAGTVPHEGEVLVDGHPVSSMAPRRVAATIAVVPQHRMLPEDMTVFDYAMLGRIPHTGYFGIEGPGDIAATRAALDRLDATDLAGRRLGTLSGGERQRVVLARALTQDAGVLLLDEPTTSLDIGHAQQVLDLIDQLRRERGMAVVSAIHDLTFAAQYADELLLLDAGSVVTLGRPQEVLTEAAISRFSGARVQLLRSPDGAPVVVPRR